MLNVLYLLLIILGLAGQNIVKKPYTNKFGGSGVYFFSALVSAAALIFFLLTSADLDFAPSVLPYSIAFAVSYTVATVSMVLAVAYGSLSITSLFTSYSLMIPTLYGLFFLGDSISIGFIPGLILLCISLFLVNAKGENTRPSVRWIVCVVLAFLGNGACSVVQAIQQIASGGAYKNEFMIVALAIVTLAMLVMAFLKERKNIAIYAKNGWHFALICGIFNGVVNLFAMILVHRMSVSLMFPLISAGGLIVTFIVSRFFYKEKLTRTQLVGFLLGLFAVIFLNI